MTQATAVAVAQSETGDAVWKPRGPASHPMVSNSPSRSWKKLTR
ncbi:hypothetical protein JJ691_101950 [Kutzneria sp. CA-103260]|nr:hypothetical protein JJ691_101950 [Kutzneria sp. CA-103260]